MISFLCAFFVSLVSDRPHQLSNIANALKANAFYIGVYCDSHSLVILHLRIFIFIPWERVQNFASFDKKNDL